MAGVKKYDIDGVSDKLQLGKHGPHLAAADGLIELRGKDGALAPVKAAPAAGEDELVTLAQLASQSATLTTETQVVSAKAQSDVLALQNTIAGLETMLAKLMPLAPPKFPSQPLTIKGTSALLAAGDVPNSTGKVIEPGASVSRVAGALVSNVLKQNGPGDSGTLTLNVDGDVIEVFDFTKDMDTFTGPDGPCLKVTNVSPYPAATPGFWTSFDAQIKMVCPATGVHSLSIAHSAAGSTDDVVIVVDDLNEKPVLSAGIVSEHSAGTPVFSSGVPHYGSDATLNVSFSMSNICGEAYEPTAPVTMAMTPDVMTKQSFSYTDLGLAVPLIRQSLSPVALTPMVLALTASDFHGVASVVASGSNVVGTSQYVVSPLKILLKQGSTGHVDEQALAVKIRTGLVAGRVSFPTENDTPSGVAKVFDSSLAVRPADATIVGGTLSHDTTNYSTGYLPQGPDLSTGRDGAQYATFAFSCAALSKFSIAVEGSYDHCWVKLPGVAEDATVSPVSAAANGWWDAFQPYNGAGAPGGEGDTLNGCALGETMSGSSGTFAITFGSATSSNATGQMILVRFRLVAGQSISYLAFAN